MRQSHEYRYHYFILINRMLSSFGITSWEHLVRLVHEFADQLPHVYQYILHHVVKHFSFDHRFQLYQWGQLRILLFADLAESFQVAPFDILIDIIHKEIRLQIAFLLF